VVLVGGSGFRVSRVSRASSARRAAARLVLSVRLSELSERTLCKNEMTLSPFGASDSCSTLAEFVRTGSLTGSW
jgi:hypothetical protein